MLLGAPESHSHRCHQLPSNNQHHNCHLYSSLSAASPSLTAESYSPASTSPPGSTTESSTTTASECNQHRTGYLTGRRCFHRKGDRRWPIHGDSELLPCRLPRLVTQPRYSLTLYHQTYQSYYSRGQGSLKGLLRFESLLTLR